jgi:hypothetical protein
MDIHLVFEDSRDQLRSVWGFDPYSSYTVGFARFFVISLAGGVLHFYSIL